MENNRTTIEDNKKQLLYKFLKFYFYFEGNNKNIKKNGEIFQKISENYKFPLDYKTVFSCKYYFAEGLLIDDAILQMIGLFINFDSLYTEFLNNTNYFVFTDNTNNENIYYNSMFFNELLRYFDKIELDDGITKRNNLNENINEVFSYCVKLIKHSKNIDIFSYNFTEYLKEMIFRLALHYWNLFLNGYEDELIKYLKDKQINGFVNLPVTEEVKHSDISVDDIFSANEKVLIKVLADIWRIR